ncbi:MAG TPA: aminotransferase class IV [Gemmatimonadaceae bacterium]|nr:aminotransferase class IV [Gemmatimonadaceae bacterium]
MSSVVYLNGQFLPRSEAKLSVDERAFFFGDGVYEVTRAIGGRLFEWSRHLKRLERGLREMRLTPSITGDELESISLRLLRDNDLVDGEAAVYLEITRGAAPRTHHFPPPGTPCTIFLSASKFTPPHDVRAKGGTAVTFPDFRWARGDIKSLNLIPSVLAKQHAVDHGAIEAIFVRDGAVTEGSHTNVFGVIDGELRTYPDSNYILSGITREVTLELAAELGIAVRQMPIFTHELPRLEELFITGTTSDVMPIVSLNGLPVGDGQPGRITMSLYEALVPRLAAVGATSAV